MVRAVRNGHCACFTARGHAGGRGAAALIGNKCRWVRRRPEGEAAWYSQVCTRESNLDLRRALRVRRGVGCVDWRPPRSHAARRRCSGVIAAG